MEFAQNHSLLVMGFVAVLGMIVWVEFKRLTRKYQQKDVNQAVMLLNQDDAVVLDVREAKELKETGKIKGAKHIPLTELQKRLPELEKSKNKPILVYCRSGNRSGTACETLTKNGFEQVNNLSGGIMAWESANMPLSNK